MKYIGWNPNPEKLRVCSGCQTDKGFHYIKNCRVKLCAKENNIQNCAYCSEFPCSEMPTVSIANPVEYRANRAEKLGNPIPDDAYTAYIEIYAGLSNLMKIRETVRPSEIKQAKRVPYSPTIIDYPETLKLSKSKADSFKYLHEKLSGLRRSSMDIENSDLVAVQERLKKRAEYVFRFLWLVGRYGTLKTKPNHRIVIDSSTYYENKKGTIPSSEEEMKKVFKSIEKYGFKPTLIPLIKDQYKTDIGNLRKNELGGTKPVWKIELGADKIDLKAFQEYLSKLDDTLGSRGYSAFSKIDMHCFV